MRSLRICSAIILFAAFLPTITHAQGIGGSARLSDGQNASFNGGGSGALIGLAASNGIDNFALNQWNLAGREGETVTAVTLTFQLGGSLPVAVHGSALDTLSIHELYSTNAGYDLGARTFGDGVETAGAVTYNFQSQTSGTEGTPWRDANGADVENLLGSFDPTPVDTVPGFNRLEGPDSSLIEFNVPIAVAQRWIDDPASFVGLVLVSNDNDDGNSRFNFTINPGLLTITADPVSVLPGDVNLDDVVDFLDIAPFIGLLTSGTFQAEADTNPDMVVDFLDIAPFIALLTSAGS